MQQVLGSRCHRGTVALFGLCPHCRRAVPTPPQSRWTADSRPGSRLMKGTARLRWLQSPCLARRRAAGRRNRALALDTRAMVNVDFSPALLLGMSLIAGGLALYQLRRLQPDISRDFDVIVSAVATFSGGILIFQGWRLDPLLLFCQLLTAGTALGFAVESLKLRQAVRDIQKAGEDGIGTGFRMYAQDPRQERQGPSLPPPRQRPVEGWREDSGGARWQGPPAEASFADRQYDGYADRSASRDDRAAASSSDRDMYYDVEIDNEDDYNRDGRDGQQRQSGNNRDSGRTATGQRASGASKLRRWSPDSGGSIDWD